MDSLEHCNLINNLKLNMRKTINSKLSENSKLSDFLKKYRNESLVFFVVFVVVFSSMKMLTGSGSNGNVEHWINLTNQMFYGKQDFLFSYGPLFWLTAGGATTQYNTYTYSIAIAFSSVLYACFWSALFTLSYKARTYIFFAVAYFLFFGSLIFPMSLLLWPLVLMAYLEFCNENPVTLQARGLIVLGLLVGMSFYIRYLYGFVALATFGSYFFSRLLSKKKISEPMLFIAGVVMGYIFFGALIFHDRNSLIDYFIINNQLSFGNSVDMTLDIKNYSRSFIAVALILLFLNIFLVLRRKSLLLTVNVLLLIFFKLGFSRTDHYSVYFVIPAATLALVMIFDNSRLGRLLFILVMGCLYHISNVPIYPGAATQHPFHFPVNFNVDYASRMQNAYGEFKLNEELLNKIGNSTIDVYPYNNEYMFANKLNYWHRPLFQSYMTLTPALDSRNQKFFESPDRPKFILWTAGVSCSDKSCNIFESFDKKLSLNEDPLTTSAILKNYHVVTKSNGRNGVPILLLEENNEHSTYFDSTLSEQIMQFGEWYKVPRVLNGVTKIIPDFKLTIFGRLKNLLFRGDVLKIKYKMVSGEIREYRLNILNSSSGVWVSPLIDNLDLTGIGVDAVMFEVSSSKYFKPTFISKWINSPNPVIHTRLPIFDSLLNAPPSSKRKIQVTCDGSIDSVNGESAALPKIDVRGEMQIRGWLAFSTESGAIADKIFLTLTDAKGEKLFISTHAEDRPDVAAAFKHPNLSGSGYKALIDLSTLNGAYVLGMAGIHNSVLFDCSQFKIPVTFSQ
jgi:hypothetical protein